MRYPLATDLKTRTGVPDKDARMKNSYIETKGEQQIIRKRPCAQGGVATGSGVAQGGIGIVVNGVPTIVTVWGDTPVTDTDPGGWTNGATYADGGSGPDTTYAALNPLDKNTLITLSNNNLTATLSATDTHYGSARANTGKSSGKWYWEVTINNLTSSTIFIGFNKLAESITSYVGNSTAGWSYDSSGNKANAGGLPGGVTTYGSTFTTSDVIGVALDMDLFQVTFYKNGVSQGVISTSWPYTYINGTVYPVVSCGFTANNQVTCNFGSSPFSYSVPSGFNSGLYT